MTCISARATVSCSVPNPNLYGGHNPMPLYFSGTNCGASGLAGTNVGYMTSSRLYIKGTLVQTGGVSMFQPSFLGTTFDSTHFADGATITIRMEGTNSLGENGSAQNTAPAYNKAFVYGNVIPALGGIGTLIRGYDAAQTIASNFSSGNHTVLPSSPTTAVNQTATMIKSNIAWSTAFAFYSHGGPGLCGDSATNLPGGSWLNTTDISGAVGAKTSIQPPVNFVFADSCNTGADTAVAYAFGIDTYGPYIQDRAFLGWTVTMQDNPSLISWTNRLYQRLLAGDSIAVAIKWANDNGGKPLDINGIGADAKQYGDQTYKLHGVYGIEGSAWWR